MRAAGRQNLGLLPSLALGASAAGVVASVIGLVLLPGFLGLSASGGRFVQDGAAQSFDGTLVPTGTYGVGVGFAVAALAVLVVGKVRRDPWISLVGVIGLLGAVFALYVGAHEVVRLNDLGRGPYLVPVRGRAWLDAGLWILESAVVLWAWVGLRARRQARRVIAQPSPA